MHGPIPDPARSRTFPGAVRGGVPSAQSDRRRAAPVRPGAANGANANGATFLRMLTNVRETREGAPKMFNQILAGASSERISVVFSDHDNTFRR